MIRTHPMDFCNKGVTKFQQYPISYIGKILIVFQRILVKNLKKV